MGIVSLLILGLLAGALAKWLLPGDDPGGVLVTMLIGVVGALLGGFLAGALFGARPAGWLLRAEYLGHGSRRIDRAAAALPHHHQAPPDRVRRFC